MATDLTTQVLVSDWKTDPSDIYIFSQKPQEMIADNQDTRLRDIHSELAATWHQLGDDTIEECTVEMRLTIEKLATYIDSEFVLRLRGVGAGLDQDRIMQAIVAEHNAMRWRQYPTEAPAFGEIVTVAVENEDGVWYAVAALHRFTDGNYWNTGTNEVDGKVVAWKPLLQYQP